MLSGSNQSADEASGARDDSSTQLEDGGARSFLTPEIQTCSTAGIICLAHSGRWAGFEGRSFDPEVQVVPFNERAMAAISKSFGRKG